ncbi:MAG: 4'-phosphopantetheinyl transferase superfamily protein [Clostridia bacterium]|nr:4'-phosphopantetheinyl transferase superfamily protein [Clostridia bacterium]
MLLNEKDGKNRIEIYLAPLPRSAELGAVYPKERDDEIKAISNERTRREKYYSWQLLRCALEHSLGIGIEELEFKKRNGKWTTDGVEFSLSHSGEALAVALSYAPVGVDIEPIAVIDREGVARRFFTEGELVEYLKANVDCREEAFLRIWTAKEAIFKSRGEQAFAPSSVDTSDANVYTDAVTIEGRRYILSAFSKSPYEVTLYTVDGKKISK